MPQDIGPYPEIAGLFESKQSQFKNFLQAIDGLEDKLLQSGKSGAPKPNWNSRWISKLDGASIYTSVVLNAPKRIVEVGSGNSTHFMCRAVQDHDLRTQVTCIDPQPRTDVTQLSVTPIKRPLSVDDVEMLSTLEANDILFIDSSHILQSNFDVDILLNRVFPRLNSGVVVHVHDIFLPYPYPESWSPFCFNEQNALIPWLLSDVFDVEFASYYVWRDMSQELDKICPNLPLNMPDNGGSLWLRRA